MSNALFVNDTTECSALQLETKLLDSSDLKEWDDVNLNAQFKRGAAWELIYAASIKFKNKYFKNEREIRLVVVSHPSCGFYDNSPSMFEDEPPIHYRDHIRYNIPVPYVKFFLNEKDQEKEQKTSLDESYSEMKKRKIEKKGNRRSLLPITEILIGPMKHQEEAKLACEILLKDQGYMGVKVNLSDIPTGKINLNTKISSVPLFRYRIRSHSELFRYLKQKSFL